MVFIEWEVVHLVSKGSEQPRNISETAYRSECVRKSRPCLHDRAHGIAGPRMLPHHIGAHVIELLRMLRRRQLVTTQLLRQPSGNHESSGLHKIDVSHDGWGPLADTRSKLNECTLIQDALLRCQVDQAPSDRVIKFVFVQPNRRTIDRLPQIEAQVMPNPFRGLNVNRFRHIGVESGEGAVS
jgi:hypothetical protein